MKNLKNRFLYKINAKGFGHHIVLPLVVVAVIAGVGAKLILSGSHADTPDAILYCNSSGIFSVLPNDTGRVHISDQPSQCGVDVSSPSWADNGKIALYANGDLNSVSASGGTPKTLYTSPVGFYVTGIAYNEPTKKVAFIEQGSSDKELRVATIGIDGTDYKALADYKPPTGYNSVIVQSISWSPNGNYLLYSVDFFTNSNQEVELFVQNINTGQRTLVNSSIGSHTPIFLVWTGEGNWSSNSNNIVGVYITPQQALIREWSLSTKTYTNIGSGSGMIFDTVTWSPDGSKIAYYKYYEGPSNQITNDLVVANANGTNAKVVYSSPSGGAITDIDWSPDSTELAFLDDNGALRVVSANGGSAIAVTGNKTYDFEWSIQ